MRKAQKKQADELLELLGRIHKGIRQMIQAGQKTEAMDLLGQCQGAAIDLGETIEQTEGEGFVTVVYLEEYCESVYQIYEKLRQGQHVQSEKAYKHLKKALQKVKNSANNDIKVRTEAVFLPYKASMWDSLESVWKAADEDPDCDAYVIPIPYYDRNPDGSFREEHYEGDLYPEYVPVTSYQDYDFAEHCPDVVFIHNPYDECNYVTSVHPFFYSRNLKQYTDKLVYIPYFILNEVNPEDQAAVKNMEHFCTVPGVIYADKVIVQSEDMRKVYVKVMTEFAKKSGMEGMDQKYWEKKILGLGSPKVDKVLNTRREDLTIPEEWLKIIEKPDGSWKKVIFYNTTVSALLQYGEQYLEKMKDVFQVFYENREDVALLWRPHPLMEATVESMRPELWDDYRRIVAEYKEAEWGIYDDTVDVDRAVAVSDGYYGDGSSVVKLCQEAEMPVLIQNCKLHLRTDKTYADKNSIRLACAVKIDKTIWFYPYYFNRLFSMEIKTGKIKYYDIPLSTEANSGVENFDSMIYINQKIYLIPFCAREILQFSLLSKEFTCIHIDSLWLNNKKELFLGTGIYGKYLFLMGVSVPVIIRIDTMDNSIDYITDWAEKVDGLIFNKKDAFFRKQSVVLNDKLFIPFCNANAVLEIDCESMETTIHSLGKEKEGYSGICFWEGDMWLSPRYHKRVVRWNMKTNEIKKIDLTGHKNEDCFYTGILYQDSKKILLHGREGEGIIVDQENSIYEPEGSCDLLQNNSQTAIYYDNRSGIMSLYEKEKNIYEKIEISIPKMYINIDDHMFNKNKVVLEEYNELNISLFLRILYQNREESGEKYSESDGELIYTQIN